MERELSNPANFGMAKSFFTMGTQAGFDMTTQEGLDAFMLAYNSALLSKQGIGLPLGFPAGEDEDAFFGPGPTSPPRSQRERQKKRQARKAQRQARKRNRR